MLQYFKLFYAFDLMNLNFKAFYESNYSVYTAMVVLLLWRIGSAMGYFRMSDIRICINEINRGFFCVLLISIKWNENI